MRKKKILIGIITMIASVILSACGSPNKDSTLAPRAVAETQYMAEEMYGLNDMNTGAAGAGIALDADHIEPMPMPEVDVIKQEPATDFAHRKLIKNANLSVETEEFDVLIAGIEERVKGLGGYMEHYHIGTHSYGGTNNRSGSITIRIPSHNYDFLVKEMSMISNVLSRDESVQDVTLQYVDLESHKKVLNTEHDRLLEFLARAETIEDIIILEQRLSSVRYQMERMESQLRTYDNLVAYSTIYLNISEVKQLTPIVEQTTWEKISTGFSKSLSNVAKGFTNFFVGLLIFLPYLVVWALIIAVFLLVIKVVFNIKKKYDNKVAAKEAKAIVKEEEPK